MIFKRLTFTIICLALSSFDFNHSLAAQPNSSSLNPRTKKTFLANSIVSNSKNTKLPLSKSDSLVTQASAIEENATSSQVEPEEPAISRHWSLVAMGVTLTVALFLLWLLFRTPSQKAAIIAESGDLEQSAANEPQVQAESSKVAAQNELNLPAEPISSQSRLDSAIALTAETKPIASSVANIDLTQELIQDLQPVSEANSTASSDAGASSQTIVRRKAIWKLTEMGDYRSIEPLLRIMSQVGATDKSLIVDAVTQIARRSFQPLNDQLFVDLEHQDPEVRVNGIRDLKRLYQFIAPVVTKIAQMQSDPDYEVRQAAIQALHQLNSSPLPTFSNYSEQEIDSLVSGKDSEANLHLVAYLLAELDTKN